jgi:hypothetical protein
LSTAFRLLIILLATPPVLAITSGALAGLVVAFAATITLAVAAMGPQSEIAPTLPLLRRFSLAMLFPIAWMTLQIVPLSVLPANPIWSAASISLNDPSLAGRVSLDPGATFRSLFQYLTILSLTVATVIVARDRHRAETIFLVLSTVTTFMSAELLLGQFESFAGTIPTGPANLVAVSALGLIVNAAAIIMAIERRLSRRSVEKSSLAPLLFRLALSLSGIVIALAAATSLAPANVLAATALGLATLLFITTVRRLELRPWLSMVIFTVFAGIAAVLLVPHLQGTSAGIAGFASSAPPESSAVAARAMSDAPWLGTGLGTFGSLSTVYQDFGMAPVHAPPSTAISVAIEWGLPALVILAVLALQFFVFAFLGAMRRGRDSFYASAAAASILLALCESFVDTSLLNLAVQVILAILIGLGLSQSVGKTSGLDN